MREFIKNFIEKLKDTYEINIAQRLTPKTTRWLMIAAVIALAIFPMLKFQQSAFWVRVIGYTGLYIILGLGLNVVVGFAGLLDLGYVAFYAIGAYTYGLLSSFTCSIRGNFIRHPGSAHARRLSGYCHIRFWRDHQDAA
jgi:ABC-type branched-subunit amino acid transport system permease subunit